MRKTEFRGKRQNDDIWLHGDFAMEVCDDLIRPCISHYHEWDYGDFITWEAVDSKTLGQYIGLNDKNNNKIFEGDILSFQDEIWESFNTDCGEDCNSFPIINYGVVGFNEETQAPDFLAYKYNENSVEADLHENHNIEFFEIVKNAEIIGNIYDNPELFNKEIN